MRREEVYEVSFGDEAAVVRRQGGRGFTTARILGRERDADGVERVWLDRIAMPHGVTTPDGWTSTGAISTVLVGPRADDCSRGTLG